MKQFQFLLAFAALLGASLINVHGEDKKPRVSPHETVNATVGDAQITIVYGRPYTKDPKTAAPRKIWGGLVPFGKPWRTGADEATLLTTSKALEIGGTSLPAGTYSLFTQPEENGTSKLIINKQTGQWGTKYDSTQDLARVDLSKTSVEQPVDQFTIAIDKAPSGGVLKLTWEKTEFSVPFTVKK